MDPSGGLSLDTAQVWDAEREGKPFLKCGACSLEPQWDLPDHRHFICKMGAKVSLASESVVRHSRQSLGED